MPIRVSTPVGESVIVEKVHRSCLVNFVGSNTYVDLVILEMVDFDVILGMTWLSQILQSWIVMLKLCR